MRRKLLALALLLGAAVSLAADGVRTLSLSEYVATLRDVQLYTVANLADPSDRRLAAAFAKLDSQYVVTWGGAEGTQHSQLVETRWMKQLLNQEIAYQEEWLNEDISLPVDDTVHLRVLANSIGAHLAEMERMGGLALGDTSTQGLGGILGNMEVEEEEDEEDMEYTSGPDLRWLDKVSRHTEEILTVLVLLVAIALGIWLLWRLGNYLDLRRSRRDLPLVSGGLLQPGDPTDSASLLKAASVAKDLPSRIRYAYLAIILKLHETGKVPYQPSWTAWEYHHEMVRLGFPERPCWEMTLTFDRTTYGLLPVDQELFDAYQQNWSLCMRQLDEGGKA